MHTDPIKRKIELKHAQLAKELIDQGWELEIGRDWSWYELRHVGYVKVLFAPSRARDFEPETAEKYLGPNPVFDLETGRLVQPGELITEWM